MRIGNHDCHEISEQLPLMEGDELAGMVDSIKVNGLLEPIVLIGDLVLDGRNRYRACLIAKMEPIFEQYAGGTDPDSLIKYVVAKNLDKRHMTRDQRAIAARRLLNWQAKQDKATRKRAKVQPPLPGVRQDTDEMARTVIDDAIPELQEAARNGEIDLSMAAAAAAYEPEQQREYLAKMREAEEPETKRAKVVSDRMASVVIELSPVDMAALSSGVFLWEKSVHAEVRAAAVLLRKIVPGVRR